MKFCKLYIMKHCTRKETEIQFGNQQATFRKHLYLFVNCTQFWIQAHGLTSTTQCTCEDTKCILNSHLSLFWYRSNVKSQTA